MPTLFKNTASLHLQELRDIMLANLEEDRLSRERHNASQPENASWLKPNVTSEQIQALVAQFDQYGTLAQDRVIDAVIDGVPMMILTQVKKIEDPLDSPAGQNAVAKGIVGVISHHPRDGAAIMLTYKGPDVARHGYASVDGDFFTLSTSDDALIEQISAIVRQDTRWQAFRNTPGINSLTQATPSESDRRAMRDPHVDYRQMLPEFALPQFLARTPFGSASLARANLHSTQPSTSSGNMSLSVVNQNNRMRENVEQSGANRYSNLTINTSDLLHKDGFANNFFTTKEEKGYLIMRGKSPIVNAVLESLPARHEAYGDAIKREVALRQQRHLTALDLDPLARSDTGIDNRLYPSQTLNFIAGGDTPEKKQYRLEFINRMLTDLYISMEDAAVIMGDPEGQRHNARLFERLTAFFLKDPTVLNQVDQGLHPKQRIAQMAGMKAMTKNEFSRAMMFLGQDALINASSPTAKHSYNDIFKQSDTQSIFDAFAMAKLPKEWVQDLPENPLFLFNHDRDLIRGLDPEKQRTAYVLAKAVTPFLINAGKALDEAQAAWHHAKDSPDKAKAAQKKSELKSISARCDWIAKRTPGSSVMEHLFTLEEKHKITATLDDYPKLIGQMITAVTMRTLSSLPFDEIDTLAAVGSDFQLEIQSDNVSRALFHYHDSEAEPETYYDDDLEEYVTDYPEPAEEIYAAFREPTTGHIKNWLTEGQYAFKDILDLNDALHKAHNLIIKEMNQYSDHDFHWKPLIAEPFEHNGIQARVITSRLDLLEEGNTMSHCVFSYLPACLAGESVILSLRNAQDERVATVELVQDGEGEDELPLFNVNQCFGHRNDRAPAEAWATANALVEQLNNRTLAFEPDVSMDNDSQDIFDEAANDHPVTQGDLFSAIPYNTDAAFLLHETIAPFLPAGKTVEGYLQDNCGCYSELYYLSEYSTDRDKLNTLRQETGLSTKTLLALKSQFNLKKIDGIGEQLAKLTSAHQAIEQTLMPLKEAGFSVARMATLLAGTATPELKVPGWGKYTQNVNEMIPHWVPEKLNAYLNSAGSLTDFLNTCPVAITHQDKHPMPAPETSAPETDVSHAHQHVHDVPRMRQ